MKTWDLERRILRVWKRSTPADMEAGSRWYLEAQAWVLKTADYYDVRPHRVAGALAAISPGNEWELSKRQVVELIEWIQADEGPRPKVSTYSARNVNKAEGILRGTDSPRWPRGPKVRAFYTLLLSGGDVGLCIDGHAINIAHGEQRGIRVLRVKATETQRVKLAYAKLSLKLGVRPSTLQAVTWVTWKREGEEVPF